MLRPQGVLCLAGLPRGETTFSAEELIGFQKAIEGSPIGSVRTIAEMFQFVVANGVRPNIECFPMAGANKAIRRLEENQVRYRVVLIQDLDVYN
jgi:D-arabinose 1-dehydrogenase-like Zn-dependent alcohol dehydrogenase